MEVNNPDVWFEKVPTLRLIGGGEGATATTKPSHVKFWHMFVVCITCPNFSGFSLGIKE